MLRRNIILSSVFVALLILVLLTLIFFGKCCFSDYCEIPLKIHDQNLIYASSEERKFLYSRDGDAIAVDRGQSVILGCPGSKLITGVAYSGAECLTETNFRIFQDNVDITSLSCADRSKVTARYTGNSCERNGIEIEIGFDFGDFFIRQMRVCFDETEQSTLYSEHNLTQYIENHEQTGKPYFEEGNFYKIPNKKIYQLYSRKMQRETINKQLNLLPNSDDIIKNDSNFFLSRGHLAPRGDFYYGLQMNASFYYVNSAPQWAVINSESWNSLEMGIRLFAIHNQKDLQIFTGTYGKLNIYGINLFLYKDNSIQAIPIPEIFWKVVFDPIAKMGIAFVGTNNPFLKKQEVKVYCKDISSEISWIKLDNTNVTRGFVYGCDVNDLRNKISFIPQLDIKGILRN
ncbi:hypothetical protein WA026_010293 [Henosepilachna vigintioctopunctata]|uniref:DNA/RNA non-specific endonuclease/pyrophosphatase/phosphodiesterase domain-containing protein n=1 Tax=Henosepilachna vigintioctopunctata TaxID=420089 RepID=A0AAW1UK24_9CUCU